MTCCFNQKKPCLKETQDYEWTTLGSDYSGNKSDGAKCSVFASYFQDALASLEFEQFCNPYRRCERPGQWLHLQLFPHRIEKRRGVLSSDQIKMRCEREFWEHLQNNKGAERVWEGMHSDYQVFGETGETRKERERKAEALKCPQRR